MNYVNDRFATVALFDSLRLRKAPAKSGQWCKSNTFLFPDQIFGQKFFAWHRGTFGEYLPTSPNRLVFPAPAGHLQNTGERFCGHKSTPFSFPTKPFANFFRPKSKEQTLKDTRI